MCQAWEHVGDLGANGRELSPEDTHCAYVKPWWFGPESVGSRDSKSKELTLEDACSCDTLWHAPSKLRSLPKILSAMMRCASFAVYRRFGSENDLLPSQIPPPFPPVKSSQVPTFCYYPLPGTVPPPATPCLREATQA